MLNRTILEKSLKTILLLASLNTWANDSIFSVGKIHEIKGTITEIPLLSKRQEAQATKAQEPLKLDTSYVSQNYSQLVIELSDGSKVRLGSMSKVSFSLKDSTLTLNLENGSLQVLKKATATHSSKMVIKTLNSEIETSDGDLVVTFKPLFEQTSLYMERGLAHILKRNIPSQTTATSIEMVHAMEYSEVTSSLDSPKSAKRLKEKDLQMVKNLLDEQTKNPEES